MKWDIDKSLAPLEPPSCPGTSVYRVQMDVSLFPLHGLKLPPFTDEANRRQSLHVWCLSIGFSYVPKAQFYGHTIRECFLRARKAVKSSTLAEHTPWGTQTFAPVKRKAKPKVKRKAARRQVDQ